MLCLLSAAYAVVALLTAGAPAAPARLTDRTPSPDSAEAMIRDEMRAFYRDLDGSNWNALVTHFLPSKVTARWAPPVASGAWTRLEVPPPTAGGAAGASGRCAPRVAVAVVDRWARVLVRRCAAPVDEAWLLRVSGHWKIVHLDLAAPPAL